MKEQKIKSIFGANFPVKITVKKEDELLHWHKGLELLCILKGKVKLQSKDAICELKEDDIFIINPEELHSVMPEPENSVYLSLSIDLLYYEKFFKEIEYTVFIDDDSINSPENMILSRDIKRRIAQILLELSNKKVDYHYGIICHISSLLAVLIDNCTTVKKKSKTFRNKEQFSRIWKAYEYMYNHYNRRVGLEEVAEYVHVSKSHLSHVIKNTMGFSFETLLNQIRAEQSIKLLLTTDKSITKISEECGFSDPKYFKNYFLQFFDSTPSDYRKQHQNNVSEDDFKTRSLIEAIVFHELLNDKIAQYLNNQIQVKDGNFLDLSIDFYNCKEIFCLNKVWKKELILPDNQSISAFWNLEKLRMLQLEIGFEYMYIRDVLHCGFIDNQPGKPVKIDWNELDRFIGQIMEMKARPKIGFCNHDLEDETYFNLIQQFLYHYRLKYNPSEMSSWILVFRITDGDKTENYKNIFTKIVNAVTDQIHLQFEEERIKNQERALYQGEVSSVTLIKEILTDHKYPDNDIELLADHRGLKSSLYFTYSMLNKLESQVINCGDHYIVTQGHNRLVILFFNSGEHNQVNYEAAINIMNLKRKRYQLKQYSLYSQKEKPETCIKNVTDADYVSDEDIKSINRARYPDLYIEYFDDLESIHRSITILPNHAELITLERVL